MTGIIREPTSNEKMDFKQIARPSGALIKEPIAKLKALIADKGLEANKKGLPFAAKVCLDEYQDSINAQTKALLRKDGYVDPSKVKTPEIDWVKYSDLKNFELIQEDEVADQDLSKRNPGLNVTIKKKVYQFKGYANKYIVMEDGPSAIARAQERRIKADTPIKRK